ncbi:hypothetical protein CJU90_1975 [Yarrowia sp. C11]|nr:hypothetical protein CKK34_6004 [Yarrowia sp. E02]KAG5371908.1 hypothetical protein CJU90_1975 [Yarrowia sp. C11]
MSTNKNESYADAAHKAPPQTKEEKKVPVLTPDQQDEIKEKAEKVEKEFRKIEKEVVAKKDELAKELKKEGKALSEKSCELYSKISTELKNPVVAANVIVSIVASIGVGYSAYQKHTRGELDGKLAGIYVGGLAAFGAFQYLISAKSYKKFE